MVFPSKEKASEADDHVASGACPAATLLLNRVEWADLWSRELNCQVRLSEPNEIFMFLGRDGNLLHVLFGDVAGWLICKKWLEVVEARA